MIDNIIIFIYTQKDEITLANLRSLEKNNPDVPIYPVCQNDFKDDYHKFLDLRPVRMWSGPEIWFWGSDCLFLHWYLKYNIRAKNYTILEWDTYAYNMSIKEFIGKDIISNNTGIYCAYAVSAKEDSWYYWFNFQRDNKLISDFYTWNNFMCCTPLCCTLISDNCVSAIIAHLKEYNFGNKIYAETKFATLGKYLGFGVKEIPNIRQYISYDINIVNHKLDELSNGGKSANFRGVFHPIKSVDTIRKYFMNTDKLNNCKIHKAYYGVITDVKDSIEKLLEIAPSEKIEINNFLNGDPAHGYNKELHLIYEKNGQIYETVIPERSFLEIDKL